MRDVNLFIVRVGGRGVGDMAAQGLSLGSASVCLSVCVFVGTAPWFGHGRFGWRPGLGGLPLALMSITASLYLFEFLSFIYFLLIV